MTVKYKLFFVIESTIILFWKITSFNRSFESEKQSSYANISRQNLSIRILMIAVSNTCNIILLTHSRLYIQVAWIKADTKAILAIHEHVITNNERLSVTHNDFNTWTLNVRTVRREDRGTYMCQVNTDPMKSQVKFIAIDLNG